MTFFQIRTTYNIYSPQATLDYSDNPFSTTHNIISSISYQKYYYINIYNKLYQTVKQNVCESRETELVDTVMTEAPRPGRIRGVWDETKAKGKGNNGQVGIGRDTRLGQIWWSGLCYFVAVALNDEYPLLVFGL